MQFKATFFASILASVSIAIAQNPAMHIIPAVDSTLCLYPGGSTIGSIVSIASCGTPVDGFPGDATALLSAGFPSAGGQIVSTEAKVLCITSDAQPVGTVALDDCFDDPLQRWTFSSVNGTIFIPSTGRCLTFNGVNEPVTAELCSDELVDIQTWSSTPV